MAVTCHSSGFTQLLTILHFGNSEISKNSSLKKSGCPFKKNSVFGSSSIILACLKLPALLSSQVSGLLVWTTLLSFFIRF